METTSRPHYHRCDFWITIEEAEDLPGQWVAHCLNLDVISQGNSPEHAWRMVAEAIAIVLSHDLKEKKNPLEHESAPSEYWKKLEEICKKGRFVTPKEAFAATAKKIAVMMKFEIMVHDPQPLTLPNLDEIPPAWLIEKIANSDRHVNT